MSSNSHPEENTLKCQEKLIFDSKQAAEATALAVKHQRGTRLKAYKCSDCGLWHLATKY